MSKNYREITRSVSSSIIKMKADIPDVIAGFNAMAKSATRSGALDSKTKELIALALGVAARCDACIGFHVQALIGHGATRLEIEEALGMAVYMGGGPSLMYAADALSAYEQMLPA
jgi:AhpD family alkylhydroperoxidase